jgi:membrane protease YdiL (CAAX protease family)
MGPVLGAIVYTTTSLVFAAAYVFTNSLRASVLAHLLNNLVAAFLLPLLPWNPPLPAQLTIGIAGLLITVFAAYKLYRRRDKEIVAV